MRHTDQIFMRQIMVNEYVCDLSAVRHVTRASLAGFDDVVVGNRPPEDKETYFLSWGDPVAKCKTGTMETGFFWDAMHIDTIGLYANSSLNTVMGRNAIMEFNAPKSAREIILQGKHPPSKYRPIGEAVSWNGVVLALQNPSDRSIHRGSSTLDYFRFVEMACIHYKEQLFLKLHPWNSGEIEQRFRALAAEHGCSIGRVSHAVIENCKFVLVYNSTFVVDCLIRGVAVAQFAPGYFYQCPGVNYVAYQFPDELESNPEDGFKLCDFLVWRYCFDQGMPIEKLVELFRHYANSRDLFPLPEELSYGARMIG